MSTNPALIVPIDLAALCVGNDDAHGDPSLYGTKDFGAVAADFAALPYVDANNVQHKVGANISDAVLPTPFSPTADPLSTGIHLHWALPDGLTHGTHDKNTGKIDFHAAPNRWLVVRTASSWAKPAAPATAMSAWVVESDHLWDSEKITDPLPQNAMSRAVLLEPILKSIDNKSYQTLGRVFRLADWKGDAGSSYLSKLTALGYGLPAYAAHYDHGPNVFGFNDALDDLDGAAFPPASSSLSYTVIGWYSDPNADPLHSFKYPDETYPDKAAEYKGKTDAIADALAWAFTADGTALPDRVVCSGVLRGITWDPARKYLQRREQSDIEVAIGNTTAECVSALIAHRNPGLDNLETILNCFQLGLLERIEQPGGSADADENLHQAQFASLSGGTIWTVQPVTPGNKDPKRATNVATTDQDILDAASRTAVLPAAVAPLLNTLNSAQQDYDGLAADILTRRSQIFADWYKYMKADYPQQGENIPVTTDAAFNYLKREIDALNVQLTALSSKKTDIDHALDTLTKALPSGYGMVTTDGPRYWQSNDPVVLVTGDDARPSSRYGGDGEHRKDGNLHCRLSGQVISTMTVSASGTTLPVSDPALPVLALSNPAVLPPETPDLVAEAFFIDPDRAPLLAKIAVTGTPNADLAGITQTIKTAQTGLLAGTAPTGAVTFDGIVPSPVGMATWSQPWIPLMLHWEIQYTPMQPVGENASAGSAYGADFISGNFTIDQNEIDLKPTGPLPGGAYQTYHGSFVLAGNPQINLAAQVDRYFKNHPDDKNATEIESIKDQLDFSAMAQALNGFNQQLLMRAQTLQLPVFDPLAAQKHGYLRGQFINKTVRDAVDDQNNQAALPLYNYNPLRAGTVKVVKLRLIDAFGQVRDIENPTTITASSLRPPSGGDSPIFLPPRIAQPSRLLFRWISAADDQVETNSHPAATPICGWVLFNHLDTSLMIYDADGNALGSLNMLGRLWQSAPGNGAMTSDPNISLAKANKHLRTFVMSIMAKKDKTFLKAMLDVIDAQMTTINPLGFKQNQGLSLLIGQPLALVRASLRLELNGRPMLDESWPAFAEAVQANNVEARPCANMTAVRFPVRLGDLGKLADGLIGYFVDDGASTLGPFYAGAAQPASTSGVAQLDPDKIALMPVASSDQSDSLKLLMLTDPRGAVHATCGILPVKDIAIPPEMYSRTLQHLAVTFLTTPVIGGDVPLAMPLPVEAGYEWSWVTHQPGADQWQTVPEAPAAPTTGKAVWPQRIEEGWLKLVPRPPASDGK